MQGLIIKRRLSALCAMTAVLFGALAIFAISTCGGGSVHRDREADRRPDADVQRRRSAGHPAFAVVAAASRRDRRRVRDDDVHLGVQLLLDHDDDHDDVADDRFEHLDDVARAPRRRRPRPRRPQPQAQPQLQVAIQDDVLDHDSTPTSVVPREGLHPRRQGEGVDQEEEVQHAGQVRQEEGSKPKLPSGKGVPSAINPTYSLSLPGPAAIGVPNFFIDSFQIPPFLIPIYQAAGIEYQVPWQVLAGINEIETDYGRNLSVSSAGAVGWMQFLPSTLKEVGRRRQRRRGRRSLQPGGRDLHRRTTCTRPAPPRTSPGRSSPTTMPAGTCSRSCCGQN